VPAVHTEALAGRGETWMSAAAGPSGDRVLASTNENVIYFSSVDAIKCTTNNAVECGSGGRLRLDAQ